MQPYYYVYRIGGEIPKVKHATQGEAQKEAERLAAQHPGRAFEILQCIGVSQTSKVSTFWADGFGPANKDDEGWIEWGGGLVPECPVPPGTLIDVKYRNGEAKTRLKAYINMPENDWDAGPCFWLDENRPGDIVAYRLSK